MYMGIKHLHMTLALLSILGFMLRGGWLLVTGEKPANRFAKIAPHVLDTLLLLSGIVLLGMTGWAFLTQGWMLLKLLFVAAYIGVGIAAFRAGAGSLRWGLFFLAVLLFVQTMAIAFSKQAGGLLALLF
ncbi:SirB2 family protein [Natronospira bacteriovora]|uniref:SirB2 family protein n=1 Tax=Natronospira bacteriovora TaxID=3069753 RepID=A0ABU0W4P8_9GAMM|nr:SirB2 family protein [Natronospira sp. AB-CW4]MDQ2068971.1 SirB2 family protein [Natronospira sp. AB-CW4]